MGWRRVAPGEWLLFYDHPKRPGARWVQDESGEWKPLYLSHTLDNVKLAIDIVATRGAIRGFEYKIASAAGFEHVPGVNVKAIDMDRYDAKRWMQTNLLWDRRITITVRNGVYTEEFSYANWVSFCEYDAWYPGRLGRRQHLVVYRGCRQQDHFGFR